MPFQPVGADPTTGHLPDIVESRITELVDETVPPASTSTPGKAELATAAETLTGTDAARTVTPAGVKAVVDPIRNLTDATLAANLSASTEAHIQRAAPSTPLVIRDDFNRPDVNIRLTKAPNGLRYSVLAGGGTNELWIIGGRLSRRYHNLVGSTNIPILLVPCVEDPTYMSMSFVIDPGTGTYGHDVVMGPTRKSYADASSQLGLGQDGYMLFVYPDDGSHTQTQIAAADYTGGHLIADGVTEYHAHFWYDPGTSSVVALIPDGPNTYQWLSWTDPLFAQSWGNQAGFQPRRFVSTDGEMHITSIAVGPPPRPPMPVRVPDSSTPSLYFPGDVKSFVQSSPVTVANLDDFDLVFDIAADDWATNGLTNPNNIKQTIAGVWETAAGVAHRSVEVHVKSTGRLEVISSPDGTNANNYTATSTVNLPATAGVFTKGRVRRRSDVGGDTKTEFFTSTDGGATWTLYDTVTRAGVVTHINPPTDIPIKVGSLGDNPVTTYPMRGKIGSVQLYTGDSTAGGALVGGVDNSAVWATYQGTPGVYTDAAGNDWMVVGSRLAWVWTNRAAQTPSTILKIKAADHAGVLNTTYVTDTDFDFDIAPGEVWRVEYRLRVDGSTTADSKFKLLAPSGATAHIRSLRLSNSAASEATAPIQDDYVLGDQMLHGAFGTPGHVSQCTFYGVIRNGSTAGKVQLQFAQNATDAVVPTRVLADSFVSGQRA